jgi:hypothetical protein
MVAARVRDGGGIVSCHLLHKPLTQNETGKASETYTRCLDEVQTISSATLFLPVTRHEAVQSMSKNIIKRDRMVCTDMPLQSLFLAGPTTAG